MSGFRPADAALEGFRITRENPRAFAVWVGLSFIINVLVVVIDTILPAGTRSGLNSINGDQSLTAGQLIDATILASPILIFGLIVMSVMGAAIYRLIFRHADERFAYLRVGMDELRLMVVMVMLFVITLGVSFLVSMATGMALLIVSFFGTNLALALVSPASLIDLIVVGAIMVRFSLAPVATVAERRVSIMESWSLTRGHFWPLLGAYALAFFCFLVVGLLVALFFSALGGAIMLLTGGHPPSMRELLKPQNASLKNLLTEGIIISTVFSSLLGTIWNVILASPGAVAYRAWHGERLQPWSAQPEAG
jgi:hypothetical protein